MVTTYKKEELKKVVLAKKQAGGGSGAGGGGGQSGAKPDVEMYDVGGEEEEEMEEQEGAGEEQEGDEGEGVEGSGKGKKGKEGEEKEGEEKDGDEKEGAGEDGEKKDGEEKEGEEKEGAGKEGKEGEEKEGKEGKGKPGKGKPSKGAGKEKGEGEGEGEGKGEGKGEGEGAGGDTSTLSREQIDQKAKELLDELEAYNNLPVRPCGSTAKRDEKSKESNESQISRQTKEEVMREKLKEIIEKASEEGNEHPLITGPRSRGIGKGGGAPQGDAIPIRMRRPDFLDKMKDFADKEYEKEYYKKGTDWFYSQAYSDILFKDRPKVSIPQKYIYLMVDVSGSMFGDFGGTGKSLLEHLIGYLPVIADEYKGEVWWISDGIITLDGKPGITKLSEYKELNEYEQSKLFKKIQDAEGTGGGTTFNVELQAVSDLREKEGHMASIIMLTDSYIDDVETRYKWEGKEIVGGLPPSTIVMTDTGGCKYIKGMFPKDFENSDLRIECYDITENGKYRMEKSR